MLCTDVIRNIYSFLQEPDDVWLELGITEQEMVHEYNVCDEEEFKKDKKRFRNLNSITCYECNLPEDIDYSKIRYLDIESNEFINVLPESFKNLISLGAYQSTLKGIPSVMENLEELILDESLVNDLPIMKKIKTLQISDTQITKLNGTFSNLEVLRADNCGLKKLPKGMKKLQVLSIINTPVIKLPSGLKELTELDCEWNVKLSKKFRKMAKTYNN